MSFFEIFQPGLRHLREEKDRLKSLVARPTHGGGAPLGIDLDTGKATFTMPTQASGGDPPPVTQPESDPTVERAEHDRAGGRQPRPEASERLDAPRRRSAAEPSTATEASPRRARVDPAG